MKKNHVIPFFTHSVYDIDRYNINREKDERG